MGQRDQDVLGGPFARFVCFGMTRAAVYFGIVGIKQTRHSIPAGFPADLTVVVASVLVCRAVL